MLSAIINIIQIIDLMSFVNINKIKFKNSHGKFNSPFELTITFEIVKEIKEGKNKII